MEGCSERGACSVDRRWSSGCRRYDGGTISVPRGPFILRATSRNGQFFCGGFSGSLGVSEDVTDGCKILGGSGGYLRVQISRRASPKVKAVYSTCANVERREERETDKGISGTKGRKRKKIVSGGCERCEEQGAGRGRSWQLGFCVVWERTVEEDQDFRVARVIEGSHYRYTVPSLLSFALLMIYRKQINDLNSLEQITKDISRTCASLTSSTDSFLATLLPYRFVHRLLFSFSYFTPPRNLFLEDNEQAGILGASRISDR